MPADAAEIVRLAECCEQATGPDRELDALIAAGHNRDLTDTRFASAQCWADEALRQRWTFPRYTASLDAAMTLVPEGWSVGLGHLPGVIEPNGKWLCRAHLRDHRPDSLTKGGHSHIYHEGHHTDLAIALTAAALRARAAQHDHEVG